MAQVPAPAALHTHTHPQTQTGTYQDTICVPPANRLSGARVSHLRGKFTFKGYQWPHICSPPLPCLLSKSQGAWLQVCNEDLPPLLLSSSLPQCPLEPTPWLVAGLISAFSGFPDMVAVGCPPVRETLLAGLGQHPRPP